MSPILDLQWAELCLGDTRYYSDSDDPEAYILQWREGTATLYIRCKGNLTIDVRVEREVHSLKVYSISLQYVCLTCLHSMRTLAL